MVILLSYDRTRLEQPEEKKGLSERAKNAIWITIILIILIIIAI